jgi:hypothetical protein
MTYGAFWYPCVYQRAYIYEQGEGVVTPFSISLEQWLRLESEFSFLKNSIILESYSIFSKEMKIPL